MGAGNYPRRGSWRTQKRSDAQGVVVSGRDRLRVGVMATKKPNLCRLCSKPVPKGVRWCPPIGGEPGCALLDCLYKLMDEGKEERPGG
jgi:hypothetical protein